MTLELALLSSLVAASLAQLAAADTTQCVGGPCGPAHQLCGAPFQNAPAFHIMDATCAENDPNGPFYDSVHGMYHLFYQDHLAEPQGGVGHGPDWGHAVSRDFVHWTRLPVAIWNDQVYDQAAIFTGSTTIVNGKPVIVYPGLCSKENYPECGTGTLFAVAVPEDPSDPLYTNWSKPSYNPIVQNTQRDPSTAWQTPAGEWRFTEYDTTIYGSMDFKTWTVNGKQTNFSQAECPSFFPLPPVYPGSAIADAERGAQPNFVRKSSHGGQDWMQVGTWVDGPVGSVGEWTATPGVDHTDYLIDAGAFYASKDFWDPVKKRRINWGWARVPPASTQSLPRVVTWHETLSLLVFSPADELEQLRGDILSSTSAPVTVGAGGNHYLGDWPNNAGNQSEIVVTFARPTADATFGVDVMTSDPAASGPKTRVYVQYDHSSGSAVVGVGAATQILTQYMEHTDLPGADFNVTNVNYKDPKICEAVCMANSECVAWTYVVRGPLYASCCQKHTGFGYNPDDGRCTSGVRTPQPAPSPKGSQAPLKLMESDSSIELRVFTDNTFVEAYWMDGRVAMTADIQNGNDSGINVFNSGSSSVVANSISVWHVNPIWVSKEEVLQTLKPL